MIGMLVIAAIVAVGRPPAWTPQRPRRPRDPSTEIDLTRLLLVATSSGLPLGAALERVAPALDGPLAAEVSHVVRKSRRTGVNGALVGGLGSLGPVLARAHASGAPVVPTLHSHLATLNAARVASALERARTAPVKLMAPLVLLLLPGFVALVVGPGLADQIIGLGTVVP